MQIDIVDVGRFDSGILYGGLHGCQGSLAPGMRGYRVMGVAGYPGAEDLGNRVVRFVDNKQQHSRAFGHRHSPPVFVERTGTLRVNKLQGVKTVIGQPTQRIRPSGQNPSDHTGPQHFQRNFYGNGAG